MLIINLLGDILAEKIDISPLATRGLLKLALKDQLGPFIPLNKIHYNDLKETIKNALKVRLEKFNFQDVDSLIISLLKTLKENQSLITMGRL